VSGVCGIGAPGRPRRVLLAKGNLPIGAAPGPRERADAWLDPSMAVVDLLGIAGTQEALLACVQAVMVIGPGATMAPGKTSGALRVIWRRSASPVLVDVRGHPLLRVGGIVPIILRDPAAGPREPARRDCVALVPCNLPRFVYLVYTVYNV